MRNGEVTARIAQRLQELRERQNLSVRAVARLSGLGTEVVSRAERGIATPNVQTLARLCAGLNVTLSEFFSETSRPSRTAGSARRLLALLDSVAPESQHSVIEGLERVFSGLLEPYAPAATRVPAAAERGAAYRAKKVRRR